MTPANIGQAYGGIAAVLAGLALCGVVISIAIQRRQLAVQLNLALRERQSDLTRMLLEHPEATANLLRASVSTERALLNLHIAQYWLAYDTDAQDPDSMRTELRMLFQTETARQWWADGGHHWRAVMSKKSRAFAQLVDEVVALAQDWGKKHGTGRDGTRPWTLPRTQRRGNTTAPLAVGAGIAFGAGILWLARRKR
ncbi:DUF6082 family protein [Actinoplanes sp. GCM10030250]|uniref:DUF6082 family protein n=1 Tax=Actinoplanes sp. GCM10030250 TaxID=3273376 RepID=UPI003621295B